MSTSRIFKTLLTLGTEIADGVEVYHTGPFGLAYPILDTKALHNILVNNHVVYVGYDGWTVTEIDVSGVIGSERFRFQGASGEHSLLVSATDDERLFAHLKVFAQANVERTKERKAQIRASFSKSAA